MDEYIKREDALDAVLFAMVGTGYQSNAISAVRYVPSADVAPKSEVAREIIDELLEALQGEVDAEEKLESNDWDESDTVGYLIHQYAKEKLDTLAIALSLYKKKYTEDQT